MVRKFFAFFLAFLISLSAFCISAFAWEPSGQDEYTVIFLRLPDDRLYPAVYMPTGSDGYTASWRLDVTSHGFTVYWDTDDAGDVENFSSAALLSLYGLSSGNLTGLDDGTGVRTEYEVEGGSYGDPDIPKNFIFEAVFSNSAPLPPDPTVPPDPSGPSEPTDPTKYYLAIYNQSGKLLKTLSGSGIGSPFKAVILPGVNRLVLSVFDSSWEFSSNGLLRLELDPSMMETVSVSQIISAGSAGFELKSVQNFLRVTLIYDVPTVPPDPGPGSGPPPALAIFGSFLTSVLGSFLAFELIPGLTLGGMFGFFIVLAIAVCVLKHFQG